MREIRVRVSSTTPPVASSEATASRNTAVSTESATPTFGAASAKSAAGGESSWTPAISLYLALAEALKYVKSIGMDKLIENATTVITFTMRRAFPGLASSIWYLAESHK